MPKIGGFEEPEFLGEGGTWQITGKLNGMLNVKLGPGEVCCGELGTMEYFQEGVNFQTKMGGKGFMGKVSSMASGESLFRCTFTNESDSDKYVGLTPNMPLGTIIPIELKTFGDSELNCKLGAYMGSIGSDIQTALAWKNPASCMGCLACCCGGPPPLVQRISTTNPDADQAFMTAMGTILKRHLAAGEVIKIDSDALIAFENGVDYDAVQVGSCCLTCCGGEGCFLTTLKGKEGTAGGNVWIQSYNMDKLTQALVTVQEESEGGDGGAPVDGEMER